jgi:hypothetical protein
MVAGVSTTCIGLCSGSAAMSCVKIQLLSGLGCFDYISMYGTATLSCTAISKVTYILLKHTHSHLISVKTLRGIGKKKKKTGHVPCCTHRT